MMLSRDVMKHFLSKAVSKDLSRPSLWCAHHHAMGLCTSDGHRAHIWLHAGDLDGSARDAVSGCLEDEASVDFASVCHGTGYQSWQIVHPADALSSLKALLPAGRREARVARMVLAAASLTLSRTSGGEAWAGVRVPVTRKPGVFAVERGALYAGQSMATEDRLTVGVNPKYLHTALHGMVKLLPGEPVAMWVSGAYGPMFLRCCDLLAVVMPMRIDGGEGCPQWDEVFGE